MVTMTAPVYDYSDDVMDFDEVLERFDPVMGLEVHVELSTKTKMFSTSSAEFGDAPNTNVDPCSLGLPGALPVVNKQGVEWEPCAERGLPGGVCPGHPWVPAPAESQVNPFSERCRA